MTNPRYAIYLELDEEITNKISDFSEQCYQHPKAPFMRRSQKSQKKPALIPHITLAVFSNLVSNDKSIDLHAILQSVDFALRSNNRDILISHVGAFEDINHHNRQILHFGCVKTHALTLANNHVSEGVKKAKQEELTRPENWNPHITIAYGLFNDLAKEQASKLIETGVGVYKAKAVSVNVACLKQGRRPEPLFKRILK